ncbi:MAG: polyhydroxybutyrate depolymerase [Porticoccaceae bacterium]|jgi:polyhydroxybutyrate depolymerase
MKKIIFIVFFISLIQGCKEDGQETDIPDLLNLITGTNEMTIYQTIDGNSVPRLVYVKTPQNLNSSLSYPIVFFFHGAGGSGQNFLYNNNITELINSEEFIGIFPNGHSNNGSNGGYWNLGSEPTTANDVEFVDLIIDQLATFPLIDTSKAYAIGFSNGSGMVNLLGKSTSHFNAIAPLFSQQIISLRDLTPTKAMSVFQVNGDLDGIIPLNGGVSSVGTFMSAENSALNWANHFNCNTTAMQEELTWEQTVLSSFTYSNCDNSHEIKYFIALNTGHGFSDEQTERVAYTQIWEFFKNY